jgi:hypothetical protein
MRRNFMSRQIGRLGAAAVGIATLFAASAASAHCTPCRPVYQPGLLAFVTGLFTAPAVVECGRCAPVLPRCVRCAPVDQHDYIVAQGPVYSGPALIAPHATYAPSALAVGYPYVSGYRVEHRFVRRPVRHAVVGVERKARGRTKTEVIHARAVVKIYSHNRMDIQLYRDSK